MELGNVKYMENSSKLTLEKLKHPPKQKKNETTNAKKAQA